MARTQAGPSVTSASSVTLLAHGMRPLTVTVPRVSRSSASVDDMAIAARADVAGGIDGRAADGAERPAALHQLLRARGKGLGLLAADADARGGRLLAGMLALLFLLEELVEVHDDALVRIVVAHADVGHDPGGLDGLVELHVARQRALGRAQLGGEAGQVLAERPHLLLLALEGDQMTALARLEVEDPVARLADGAGGEEVGLLDVVGLAHLSPSAARSPSIELTVRTASPEGRQAIALMEAVPITMRWKRSSGVPRAWATAALMGSAWETATTM